MTVAPQITEKYSIPLVNYPLDKTNMISNFDPKLNITKFFVFTLMFIEIAAAQTASLNLQDINLDGVVKMMAFGDSITRGVGDGFPVGAEFDGTLPTPPSEAGYPLRLENKLGISVSNQGVRGEFLSTIGIFRFSKTASNSNADYIIISEGANDTFLTASSIELRRDAQAIVNMTKALGKIPVILTIPSPCCGHSGSAPFIDSYNQEYRDLADLNQIPIADSAKAFAQTCTGEECFLFNIPDGLHPNTKGYDAMAETLLATFYGIDLLGPGGNVLLAQALGVDPSTIVVASKPTPVTQTIP